MRLLLDTHVAFWWTYDRGRLDPKAMSLIAASTRLVSAASIWEAAIKRGRGRLPGVAETFPQDLSAAGVAVLSIDERHAWAVQGLPPVHKDPFDRLIVAQARLEGLPLATRDRLLVRYGVEIVPA